MESVEDTLVWRALAWEQFSMKSPRQRHQLYAMAFPRNVDASLIENVRATKQSPGLAKTQ